MNKNNITLPSFYLQQVLETVSSYGINVPVWLEGLGIAVPDYESEQVTMEWQQFRLVVKQAMELTKEPSFGLMVGQRLLVNTHGILGFAAMNSANLRELVNLIETYIALRTDLVKLNSQQIGPELRVVLEEQRALDDIRQPVLEAIIQALKNVLDYVAMGMDSISYIALPFAQDKDSELLQAQFRCEIKYHQDWAGFAIPSDLLDKPLTMANSASYRDAKKICQQELEALESQTSLSANIRKLLLTSSNGFPTLELVARRFHMTPRTLHRRLVEEETSYKELLDEVRHLLAKRYLDNNQLSIQEIAFTLGYSDIANFRRAFKRWQGMAPSEYQKRNK